MSKPSNDEENFIGADTGRLNAEIEKERVIEHLKVVGDLRKVLSIPEGRRFVWEQLARAGIYNASFCTSEVPGEGRRLSDFKEGQRDIGIQLLLDVNEANPSAFAQMQAEYFSVLKSKKKKEQSND